jgi:DNA-binding NarL/FixJ family response regulator
VTSDSTDDRLQRAAALWRLTRRQREVLGQLARGLSNKEIATSLGCAVSTVELHVSQLFRRSGVQGRAALVARFWSQ